MISVLDKAHDRTLGLQKKLVEGDPYDVIPVKDRKCAKSTLELYLSIEASRSSSTSICS